jgi:type IV pilus assembly protein PilE
MSHPSLLRFSIVNKGFSLIELLIVLTMIGILVSIAYPGYREHIIRAHRSDGQTSLLDLATRLERYYAEHDTYQTATIGDGKETDVLPHHQSAEGWYTLSIDKASDTYYTLLATPKGSQGTHDALCQTLTFDHLGRKGIAVGPLGSPSGSTDLCW